MINYDLPSSPEKYFRRAEKCKKNKQKTNLLLSFVTAEDKKDLPKIENFLNIKIEELPMNVKLFFVELINNFLV